MRKIEFEKLDFDPDKYLADLMDKKEFSDEEETPQMFVNSPMGVESVLDPFNLTRHFQFYIVHTNFSITAADFLEVERTPGVDILRKMTRYRFLVAFGKVFDPQEVQEDLQARLCDEEDEEETEIKDMIEEFHNQGVAYCIYINEKGFRHTTERDKNFESMKEIFREAKEKHGGEIIEG